MKCKADFSHNLLGCFSMIVNVAHCLLSRTTCQIGATHCQAARGVLTGLDIVYYIIICYTLHI